jgi:SHS2 domain-containing protein
MYEFFEHTADLGLRVVADDLPSLFRDAATGLFAMIVEGDPRGDIVKRYAFSIEGSRRDLLMFDWLNELLYRFETERHLLGRFEVELSEAGLRGSASGFALGANRDRLIREVKAITYHGLKLERHGRGWLAEVIVDI